MSSCSGVTFPVSRANRQNPRRLGTSTFPTFPDIWYTVWYTVVRGQFCPELIHARGRGCNSPSMNSRPARVPKQEAAKILGFAEHDIPILIKTDLLRPLGKPAPNGPKWFATCVLEVLANDPKWLDKATKAVNTHWERKNCRRKEPIEDADQEDA
jgi:hypothetical protein